jgi:hypothetical protein
MHCVKASHGYEAQSNLFNMVITSACQFLPFDQLFHAHDNTVYCDQTSRQKAFAVALPPARAQSLSSTRNFGVVVLFLFVK